MQCDSKRKFYFAIVIKKIQNNFYLTCPCLAWVFLRHGRKCFATSRHESKYFFPSNWHIFFKGQHRSDNIKNVQSTIIYLLHTICNGNIFLLLMEKNIFFHDVEKFVLNMDTVLLDKSQPRGSHSRGVSMSGTKFFSPKSYFGQ